jgi:hypothetical protein
MTIPTTASRGGFKRRVRLGWFIRDYLASQDASATDIYSAYKKAVRNDPDSSYLRLAKQRIRRKLAKEKRTRPRERVKVNDQEILDNLPAYQTEHPFRSKKSVCSYNSFMHYIWVLKKLGLVEDTGEMSVAAGKSGSESTDWHEAHPSVSLRAVSGRLGDSAWDDLWAAYHNS